MKNKIILWVFLLTLSYAVSGQNVYDNLIKNCPSLKTAIDENKDLIDNLKKQTYTAETFCQGEKISKTIGFPQGSRGDVLGVIANDLGVTNIEKLHNLKSRTFLDLKKYCFDENYTIKSTDYGGLDCILENILGGNCDHNDGLLCKSEDCIERVEERSSSYLSVGDKKFKLTEYEIFLCKPKKTETVTTTTEVEQSSSVVVDSTRIKELEEELEEAKNQEPEIVIIKEDSLIYRIDTVPTCSKNIIVADSVDNNGPINNFVYVKGNTGLQLFSFTDSEGMYNNIPFSLDIGYENIYAKDSDNCRAKSLFGEINFSNIQARALEPDKCRLIDWHMWKYSIGGEVGHHWWKAFNDEWAFRHGPTTGYEYWVMDPENKRGIDLSNSREDLPDVETTSPHNFYLSYHAEFRYYITKNLAVDLGLNAGYSFTQKRVWAGPHLSVSYAFNNAFVTNKSLTGSTESTKFVDPYEGI